jgi:DNA protecting protein DprA
MSLAFDHDHFAAPARRKYAPPTDVVWLPLHEVIRSASRNAVAEKQLDLLRTDPAKEVGVFISGDKSLFERRSVAIVGARDVSDAGKSRSYKLARELAEADIVVVSGLAKGVDTAAHYGAIQNGGRTIGVIGTPLTKAYPAENKALQEEIYQHHLLVSPFAPNEAVFKANFPKRNRVMALISDATVIVEASDTSGSLHQAAECVRSDRWLFIMKSVLENPSLTWPEKFLGNAKVRVFSKTNEIIDAISL